MFTLIGLHYYLEI